VAKTGSPILILFISASRLEIGEFAAIAFGFLVFSLTQVVLDLGYQVRLPKVMASGRSGFSEWFGTTLGIKLILAIFLFSIFALFFWATTGEEERKVSVQFLVAGIFSSIMLHFLYVLRGSFMFPREAATLVTSELMTLLAVVVFCGENWTAAEVAFIFLVAKGLQAMMALIVVWPLVRPIKLKFCTVEIRAAVPYTVQTVVGAGFLLIDGIVVKGFVSDFDFSVQQMFVRLLVVACFVLGPVQILLVSYFSKIAFRDSGAMNRYVWAAVAILSLISTLFFVTYWYFDDEIVQLLLGEDFSVLTGFTWLLVSIAFLRYVSVPFGVLLSVSGSQVTRAKILGSALVFLVGLNFLFVPKFGIVGSFYSSLLAHVVLLTAYLSMGINCMRRLELKAGGH
jgi:O-antigen/teichoic acid export membrane protein